MDQKIEALSDLALPFLINLVFGILIFVIGWMLSKWVNRGVQRIMKNQDAALKSFLGGLAQYTVLAATIITALGTIGIKTTGILTVLASAGLAVGMALQGSLANFASGVMILIFRPFTLGHRVTAAGHTGTVQDIGIFATTLKTPSADIIIIPNKSVTGGAIINHTVEGKIRATINVGVAYGTKVEVVLPILLEAATSAEHVLKDPEPAVVFVGLGASSLDFDIRVWANSANFGTMQHNVRTNVYNALEKAGIEIPFTQVVVHNAN